MVVLDSGCSVIFSQDRLPFLRLAKINDHSVCNEWLRCLDENEKERYAQYKFRHDAFLFAGRRYFVKSQIMNILRLKKRPQFEYSDSGKPFLPDSPLFFNWSYSREFFAFAAQYKREIGIDLESIDLDLDYISLWKNVVIDHRIEVNREMFYRVWTAKEAVAKAYGSGLKQSILSMKMEFDKITGELLLPAKLNKEILQYKIDNCILSVVY